MYVNLKKFAVSPKKMYLQIASNYEDDDAEVDDHNNTYL